jgi:hypothetical protein
MVKCHAMILLNIANRPGIDLELPHLQAYIDDPDTVLEALAVHYLRKDTPANRKAAKGLINSVLNRGTTAGWVLSWQKWLVQEGSGLPPREVKKLVQFGGNVAESVQKWLGAFQFGKEICQNVSALGDHPLIRDLNYNIRTLHAAMRREYPQVFQDAIEAIKVDEKLRQRFGGSQERMEGKAFSDCLFEIEKRLLQAIIRAARELFGYRVDSMVHDGCHVRIPPGAGDTMPAEHIKAIENMVKTELQFDIKLKVKPF